MSERQKPDKALERIQPPAELLSDVNRVVLAHLEAKSAHSDLVNALTRAAKPLGDVQLFCPGSQQYRYVVVSTKGIIFGFAISMKTIAFRLDARLRSRALTTGASAYPECGPEWVSFALFENDWPRIDLEFWASKAYVCARERKANNLPARLAGQGGDAEEKRRKLQARR